MTLTPHPSPLTPSLRRKTIGIVGAGNMGQALLKGLLKAGATPKHLAVVEADVGRARLVSRRYHVRAVMLAQLVRDCDIVILAVKPQDLRGVLLELRKVLRVRQKRMLVISIAAGVRTAAIERIMGRAPVIRVMPNLPATVGCGISALAKGRFATSSDLAVTTAIFRCVGEVVELPQRHFDIVTALSGSGPAYFFLIFKALRDAGMREGLPKAVAQRLATQTAIGSARLASQSRDELETLIARVASKKGTTEAALRVFAHRGLARIIQQGVQAAVRRSRHLSQQVSDT